MSLNAKSQIEAVHRRVVWLFIVLALSSVGDALSQERSMRFARISIEHGLSQSFAFSIFQDSAGFLWIGTQDGLNKYDGYHFTTFKNNPDDSASLINNTVTCIVQDSTGSLWLGTDGGLSRLDPKQHPYCQNRLYLNHVYRQIYLRLHNYFRPNYINTHLEFFNTYNSAYLQALLSLT